MNAAHDKPVLLLVDDDASFCEALGRAMTRRGFEVIMAANSDSALSLAGQQTPQYAIIDLRLGETSGLPLVEQLLRLNACMRIIMLTGYASIATAVEAIKLGAMHYLTKPAEPDDILAAFQNQAADASIPPAPGPMSVRRLEWEHLQRVLLAHEGNISAAARALNMHRRTLQRKLQKRPVGQ